MAWVGENKGEEETASWTQTNKNGGLEERVEKEFGEFSTFKSMLEGGNEDWYTTATNRATANSHQTTLHGGYELGDISFSQNFTEADNDKLISPTDNNIFDPSPQVNYFLPSKSIMPTHMNPISNNPLDSSFDLGCGNGFLGNSLSGGYNDLNGTFNFNSNYQFPANNLLQLTHKTVGFGESGVGEGSIHETSSYLHSSKVLKPLENFTLIGSQPTLFQKRAAARKNLGNLGSMNIVGDSNQINRVTATSSNLDGFDKRRELGQVNERKRENRSGDEDVSINGSNLNYDSEDQFLEVEESEKNGGNDSNVNSTVTGRDQKGKKKGPAKNLMAERRRRNRLNERLYLLRSVVPKISKMDRTSILGDAIEYLNELLQKINDLHNELESTPPSSSLTPNTSFHMPGFSSTFATPLSSPTGQPARVEVWPREGRAVNIHMFCGHRPGLLLSTMKALDSVGLDIQQAVISCFSGFTMDIFRAEQCKGGQDLHPDQIKALLLDSASFNGMV